MLAKLQVALSLVGFMFLHFLTAKMAILPWSPPWEGLILMVSAELQPLSMELEKLLATRISTQSPDMLSCTAMERPPTSALLAVTARPLELMTRVSWLVLPRKHITVWPMPSS